MSNFLSNCSHFIFLLQLWHSLYRFEEDNPLNQNSQNLALSLKQQKSCCITLTWNSSVVWTRTCTIYTAFKSLFNFLNIHSKIIFLLQLWDETRYTVLKKITHEIKERDKNWHNCGCPNFLNFDLGGYFLRNGILPLFWRTTYIGLEIFPIHREKPFWLLKYFLFIFSEVWIKKAINSNDKSFHKK